MISAIFSSAACSNSAFAVSFAFSTSLFGSSTFPIFSNPVFFAVSISSTVFELSIAANASFFTLSNSSSATFFSSSVAPGTLLIASILSSAASSIASFAVSFASANSFASAIYIVYSPFLTTLISAFCSCPSFNSSSSA